MQRRIKSRGHFAFERVEIRSDRRQPVAVERSRDKSALLATHVWDGEIDTTAVCRGVEINHALARQCGSELRLPRIQRAAELQEEFAVVEYCSARARGRRIVFF